MNLDDLFVNEHYRGKKIGQQLMQHAQKICTENNINSIRWEVETDNERAISFYKSLGANMVKKGIFKWKMTD